MAGGYPKLALGKAQVVDFVEFFFNLVVRILSLSFKRDMIQSTDHVSYAWLAQRIVVSTSCTVSAWFMRVL